MATAEEKKAFATQFRRCRGLAGISIDDAAALLGVHRNTIIAWEKGAMIPPARGTVLYREDAIRKIEVAANQVFADNGMKTRMGKEVEK